MNLFKKAKEEMVILSTLLMTTPIIPSAQAITQTDLTQDMSGDQTLSDVLDKGNNTAQETATLIIQIVTIIGYIVVAVSLYQFYKAGKDEREKPTSAFIGLGVGGAMAAVGTVMWIMKSTFIS